MNIKLLNQFIKFTIVGATNSAVYLGVYYFFIWIYESTLMALIGQAVAWVVSVANSYVWNSKFVFAESDEIWWRALIKVYLGYGASLGIYTLLTYAQLEFFGVSYAIVPIVNLLAVGPLNFVIIKYWSFNNR